MADFCLIPSDVQKFKKALKDGSINPFKMAEMTSKDRSEFLSQFVGEDNAKQVNTLFESKLLLKNQKIGYQTWAKKVAGLSPRARQTLQSKIAKLEKALDPEEEALFLEDFVESKLQIGVSLDEAQNLAELSRNIKKADGIKDEMGLPSREYMTEVKKLADYVKEITPDTTKTDAMRIAGEIAGLPRSLMTTADFSASFRQGIFLAGSNPKAFTKAFFSQFKPAFSEKAYEKAMAEIETDPFYSLVPESKLAITDLGNKLTKREEVFTSSFVEKIPVFGALPRGSARAYTTFLNKLRFDVFKTIIKDAQKMGRDPVKNPELLKDIAKFVNTATGRGGLGKLEPASNALAQGLFSPRLVSSRLSLLNPVFYAKLDPLVRKQALKSLIAFTSTGLTILALAKLNGAEVEDDPRSADFGKIQIGRTRIDIWGGFQQYIRLGSQLFTNQQKSTTTGMIKDLGSDVVTPTRFDVGVNFLIGKSAPVANYIAQWAKGKSFDGSDFEPTKEAIDRLVPIMVGDIKDMYDQGDLKSLPYQGLALFGFGVQTYDKMPKSASWVESTGKELTQFREKVGEKKFKEAETEFNKKYDEWLKNTKKTDKYKSLSDEAKKKLIDKAKDDIKSKVFKSYKFKYKEATKNIDQRREDKEIKSLLP